MPHPSDPSWRMIPDHIVYERHLKDYQEHATPEERERARETSRKVVGVFAFAVLAVLAAVVANAPH